jgi:RNA polymerase sigma-70 factor, ECF subfamily
MDSALWPGLSGRSVNPAIATTAVAPDQSELLEAAQNGDPDAFERLIESHRAALQAHCYRMLGSVHDAEDALQDALLRAWGGIPKFEGRSSLRSWLYRIATNTCLRMLERRPGRVLPIDHGPAAQPHDEPAEPLVESVWVEPYRAAAGLEGFASPEARYEQRESVELAFIAALQHLPPRQRAVLILRDVLGFDPSEIAAALETTPAAVYSALQRARASAEARLPDRSQQATLRRLGDERLEGIVKGYVEAWERGDVEAIVEMLTEDAAISMPPRPTWYRGREAVGAFLSRKPLAAGRGWLLLPVRANGQFGFATYGWKQDRAWWVPHGIQVLTFAGDGRIREITTFLDREIPSGFTLPDEIVRQP